MAGWTVVPNGDTSAWKPVKAAPAPPQGNAIQRAFEGIGHAIMHPVDTADNLTTVTPEQDANTPALLKPLAHFGAGAIQGATSPFVHSEQTVEGIGHAIMHPVDTAQSMWASAKEDPAKAVGNLVGGAALGEGVGDASGAVSRAMAGPMERGGLNLGNAALGARGPKPFKYGADPARGAFEEGVLPAMSKHSASLKLEKALPGAGQRISDAVMQGGTAPLNDIANSIEGPANEARSIIQGPGGGNRSVDPIDALVNSMTQQAPGASSPIYGPKLQPTQFFPDATAPDVWRTIQNVDKNTRFNPDPEVEGVNELRRDMRGGLRGNLEDAVPGLKPLSQRYGDLKSAEEVLDRSMHGGTSLRKMVSVPTFPIESAVGRAMYGTGKAMAHPEVFENAAPAMGVVQALRNEKKKE
jgi:hypothetical protein